MEPYFMSAGTPPIAGSGETGRLFGARGPDAYGYRDERNIRVYGFDEEVSSIADRGDFLFQDRVQLANDFGRGDVIRVFFIGGSTAYGVGASSRETRWYSVLEEALSTELRREVRLIPAAMIGYVSTQERLILDLIVLPRRPEVVIILDGFNDAVLPALFGTRPGDPYDQGILYEEFYSPLFGLKKALARRSHFARFLLYRSFRQAIAENKARIAGNPHLLANYARSTASVYLDNVRQMLDRCKDEGVTGLAFLQPVSDLTLRSQGSSEDLNPFALASYDEILNRLPSMAPEHPIHDLTSVFNQPGREKWFVDSVHFEDAGHKAVAEAMYPILRDAIRERLLKTPSQSPVRGG
jgi:lysophospholipase L1-like esterase